MIQSYYCLLAIMFFCAPFVIIRSAIAQTWTQTTARFIDYGSMACSADGTIVVAGSSGLIATSTNSGSTWVTKQLNGMWQGLASSADGIKLIGVCGPGSLLYTSTNSGNTWVLQTNAPSVSWRSVASSADGTKLVAAGLNDGIYTSTDSGVDWISNNAPSQQWNAVASSADGTMLAAGIGNLNSGTIYTSTNSGYSWVTNNVPNENWSHVAFSADGTKILAMGGPSYQKASLIFISTNSGNTWAQTNAPTSSTKFFAASADGSKLVAITAAANYSPIYTSTNFGMTWTSNKVAASGAPQALASSADGGRLYASGGTIYTAQSTLAPYLNSSLISTNPAISWIIPSTNFILQQNADLTTTNWLAVTNMPTITNFQEQVLLSPFNAAGFYRLRTP